MLGFGEYISQNCYIWTGADLCDLYYEFSRKLKESIGSSSNFTGMSEYLVFHTVKGLLGFEFSKQTIREKKGVKDDEMIRNKFVNKKNNLILLTQYNY